MTNWSLTHTFGSRALRFLAPPVVAGTWLILTLGASGRPAPGNPFRTLVYSYGHRNAQGIVFHPETRVLYVAEHGPRDNDEVNRVEMGGNYDGPLCTASVTEIPRVRKPFAGATTW